ncbi:unnamed protein product [Caenorhabditis bovis]|uniref:Uncharacterized protein n=1 Tax=Caenorhabditis bovis TaxID=2654633 RepID=A0A8S1F0Z6_9PELO|nr:unnamed protein product [Caenorhabditis bovis]
MIGLPFSRRRESRIVYAVFVIYLFFRLYFFDYESVPKKRRIEEVPLNCDPIINGTENERVLSKAKQWDYHFNWIEDEMFTSKNICEVIHKYYKFADNPISEEEENYPLSFGLVVYKNIVQVILQLSIFYQPQHLFCITVDEASSTNYKNAMRKLPSCFPNMKVAIGEKSEWGSFGILKNVYSCFDYLTKADHDWKYYQYLSGTDLPLRTNLEMVRIFKALNGSINTDVEEFEVDRYKNMEGVLPPVPVYKSSMSVLVPREAANFIVKNHRVRRLLQYLKATWIPDESFWTSVAGSPKILPVPGSFRARDIFWLRKHFRLRAPEKNTVDYVGTSYIGRYQVWAWQKECYGKLKDWSCVFGVGDIEEVVTRPEMIAHKLYIDFEPAGMMCLFKEIRRREHLAENFDASSYAKMPTVEMHQGRAISQLTHPNWIMRNSFYNPENEDDDKLEL